MDLLEFSTRPCSGCATSPALLQVAEWSPGYRSVPISQSSGRFCPSLESREGNSGVNWRSLGGLVPQTFSPDSLDQEQFCALIAKCNTLPKGSRQDQGVGMLLFLKVGPPPSFHPDARPVLFPPIKIRLLYVYKLEPPRLGQESNSHSVLSQNIEIFDIDQSFSSYFGFIPVWLHFSWSLIDYIVDCSVYKITVYFVNCSTTGRKLATGLINLQSQTTIGILKMLSDQKSFLSSPARLYAYLSDFKVEYC